MMFCPNCGAEAQSSAKFCMQCGQTLALAHAAPAGPVLREAVTAPAAAVASGAAPAVRQGQVATKPELYAPIWKRIVGYLLDVIGLLIPFTIVNWLTGFQLPLVLFFVAGWAISAWLEAEKESTPGKELFDLVVTDLEGKQLTLGRSIGRSAVKIAAGSLLGVGFLPVFFTARRQCLHDLVAGTVVVTRASTLTEKGTRRTR